MLSSKPLYPPPNFYYFLDECKEASFKCEKDGTCILAYAVCDGMAHCSDAYDEMNTTCCKSVIAFHAL